jgi:hypothetical protein
MAQDGEVTRWLLIEGPDGGPPIAVRFGDFNPRTMKLFACTTAVSYPHPTTG